MVGSLANVQVRVSEELQPGIARVLTRLFPVVRSTGLVQNSAANPDLRPALTLDSALRLLGGDDGTGDVEATRFTGAETSEGRTGLHALDTVGVNIVCLPGRTTPDYLAAAMTFCERNDAFFVADGIGSIDPDFAVSADEVRQAVEILPTRSKNAAMFYPWIQVPTRRHRPQPAPLRAAVRPRGGHLRPHRRARAASGRRPAGIEAIVTAPSTSSTGSSTPTRTCSTRSSLNCIRQFPGVGIVNWGARTLPSDPEWRYVPVRRTGLFLKESLRRGLQWAVFEPNDEELWDRIRDQHQGLHAGAVPAGAFQGATPDEAFVVMCDRETNPQETVDAGDRHGPGGLRAAEAGRVRRHRDQPEEPAGGLT